MLRRWMANDPEILGSDTDVLDAIADGQCDVGLTNSYYLGRELEEDPDFPVAPVWADQNGRGTHVNLSGLGVVKGTDQRDQGHRADALPDRARAAAGVRAQQLRVRGRPRRGSRPRRSRSSARFKRDPIDVQGAGEHLEDALLLMEEVGWD